MSLSAGHTIDVTDPAPSANGSDVCGALEVMDGLAAGRQARDAHLRSLWQMTVAERIAAMRRGELSYKQCAAWTARHPEQVPLLNGEFEWLAAHTPEVCE